MGKGESSSGFGCIRMKGNSATRSLKIQEQSCSSILMAFNFTFKNNNHACITVTEKNEFTIISTSIKYIPFMDRTEYTYFGAAYINIFFPMQMNDFDGYNILIHGV
jgi:hypothetical protein